ncbi:acetyltransferase [Vibrio navarrensis]|uniref:acetyltransferase n=1 Tax=Vibrio navarrensis TaxID=29495 RepID=UPI00051DBB5E|nr:acetyltransferase [Vibrio navarrensis]KGK16171.1 hypothetical protein EA25_16710 [Vibrio navarrensis]
MVILGAGGFAKEIATVLLWNKYKGNIVFFDNTEGKIDPSIMASFTVLRSDSELFTYLKNENSEFCLGVGKPELRYKLHELGLSCNGKLKTLISEDALVGSIDVNIGKGTVILSGVTITASITIGKCCVINKNTIISHDVTVGDYVEISPGARLLGNVQVGDYSIIGTNAVILPKVKIGKNCIIGAGSVVTKSIPDNSIVMGVPAKSRF